MSTILRQRLHRLLAAGLLPVIAGILTATVAPQSAQARTGYPKIFGWYLSGTLSQDQIPLIAKYDVLVLDADFPYDNVGELDQIRALNPDIKILAFIASNGTGATAYERPPETVLHQHWQGINDGDFWLYAVDGSVVEDWPGKWSANLTPNGPVNSRGEHYWTWFARFVDEAIWQTGQWDGVLLDDVWENISWLNSSIPSPIDSDRDGIADSNAQLDAWWAAIEDSLTQAVRARLGPSAIVIGNGPNHYYSALNGTIIENFPFNGPSSTLIPSLAQWTKWMYTGTYSYFADVDNFRTSPQQVTVINTFAFGTPTEPDTTGRFEAHKRFTLGSTLLSDGYYSLDYDWHYHNSLWWEPEYDMYMGDPDGPAYSYLAGSLAIWRRDFAEASVVVNPNPTALTGQPGLPDIGAWDAYIGPRIVDPAPPDTIPPASTPAYYGRALGPYSGRLKWKAAGDDGMNGRADSFLIRMSLSGFSSEAVWEAATPIPNSLVPPYPGLWDSLDIGGLQPSTAYYFAVKTVDEAGNVAPLGPYYFRIITEDAPAGDTTPPAAIADLHVVSVDTTSAVLAWTAPGDDGTTGTAALYEGRLALTSLTEANWAAAQPVSGLPAPAAAGTAQGVTVTGLDPSTTYFVAIKSQDEASNVSPLGNVASFTTATPPPPPPPPDTTGPDPVVDLAVTGAGETWLTLGFTAPADSQGTVKIYDLRYVTGATFDPGQWTGAAAVPTETPLPPGTAESITVSGLASGQTYTFRLQSADDSGNPSDLSNPAAGTTPVPPDTTGPAAVADLAVSATTQHTVTVTFTAPADQEGTVTAYDLRWVSGTTFPDGAWDAAAVVPTGTPRVPGAAETLMVGGLDPASDYALRVRSVDDAGNWSALGNTASGRTQDPTDTLAPSRVTDLAAAIADTYVVVLSWTAPGDDGVSGQAALYDLRWRPDTLNAATWDQAAPIPGVPAPHVSGYLEILQITGLPADVDLAFALTASDEAGNRSPISNVATARIVSPQPPDTQPPGPVEGLRAVSDPEQVDLNWDPGPEPDLDHYRLYRGRGATGTAGMILYRSPLEQPAVVDDQVIPGREYCYAVTAVDVNGNESALSAPLTVRIPFSRFIEPIPPFLEVGDPYPNPTRGALSLDYETPGAVRATVEVFDVRGRRVRTLTVDAAGPGRHEVHWDGRDASGRQVARGIYFMRFKAGTEAWTRKIQVLP
jgi:hypothetical protein